MRLQNHSSGEKQVKFFPNVLLAEMSLAIIVLGCLTIFVSLFPVKVGEKFDPLHPPTLLEPEWYFMGFYQFLKTQSVQPLDGVILMTVLGVFILLIPFLDRGSERHPLRRPIFVAAAFFIIVQFLALTIYGFLTPGHVATFSEIGFTIVFVATNTIAVGLVLLAFAMSRRSIRRMKS
jgi:ubiquinol-cytochrome c reductase cytochrome b subunit